MLNNRAVQRDYRRRGGEGACSGREGALATALIGQGPARRPADIESRRGASAPSRKNAGENRR